MVVEPLMTICSMGGDVQPNSCMQQAATSSTIIFVNPDFMAPLFPCLA
jgi:hypothetical protein